MICKRFEIRMLRFFAIAMLAIFALPSTSASLVRGDELDFMWQHDPEIKIGVERTLFSEKLLPLWINCLERNESDVQHRAAEAIARSHRIGMRKTEPAIKPLVKVLSTKTNDSAARLAAAKALIEIEAKSAADSLWAVAQEGDITFALAIEPCLIDWKYAVAKDVWRKRLDDPLSRASEKKLAFEGLVALRDNDSTPKIAAFVSDVDGPADVRLAAAKALATLSPIGQEKLAEPLASSTKLFDRLLAATILNKHSGDAAVAILQKLALDADGAIATIALGRMNEIDPTLIGENVGKVFVSADPGVRRRSLDSLVGLANPQAIAMLGKALDDSHPDVRIFARQQLIKFGKENKALLPDVRKATASALMGDRPRAQGQAIIVAAELDIEDSANRMIQLLTAPTPAVQIAAAWGLKKLAVPSTAEAMLKRVKEETKRTGVPIPVEKHIDPNVYNTAYMQVAHLIEALGVLKYNPAEETFVSYLPKPPLDPNPVPTHLHLGTARDFRCRTAAVWSLGQLHLGDPDPKLVEILSDRMSDIDINNPESLEVRSRAAIALGRMGAKDQIETLKGLYLPEASIDEISVAAALALGMLTGNPLPPAPDFDVYEIDWFIQPLDREKSKSP